MLLIFIALLGTTSERNLSLHPSFWNSCVKLTSTQTYLLEKPFTEEEIKKIVFSYNSNKAPGPNGFSFQFYQSFWDLVSRDVCKLVNVFYYNQLDVSKLNLAVICLILKQIRC
jgi:hypothetical protein